MPPPVCRLAGGTRHAAIATLLTKEVQLYVTHENAANVFTAECHMAHADVMRHGHVVIGSYV